MGKETLQNLPIGQSTPRYLTAKSASFDDLAVLGSRSALEPLMAFGP